MEVLLTRTSAVRACVWRSRGPREGALLVVRSAAVVSVRLLSSRYGSSSPRYALTSTSSVLRSTRAVCVCGGWGRSGHPTRSLGGTAVRASARVSSPCLSSRRQGGVWLLLGRPSDGSWASLLCALPEVVVVVVALWVVVPVFGRQLSS